MKISVVDFKTHSVYEASGNSLSNFDILNLCLRVLVSGQIVIVGNGISEIGIFI